MASQRRDAGGERGRDGSGDRSRFFGDDERRRRRRSRHGGAGAGGRVRLGGGRRKLERALCVAHLRRPSPRRRSTRPPRPSRPPAPPATRPRSKLDLPRALPPLQPSSTRAGARARRWRPLRPRALRAALQQQHYACEAIFFALLLFSLIHLLYRASGQKFSSRCFFFPGRNPSR